VAMTPDLWLERLSRFMDQRRPRLDVLRSYMDGYAPLPEGAEGCREAYQKFQRKARTNFGELVVDAVVERMIVSGFRVGDSNEDDDAARRIWKRNRLQIGSSDVHRDMVGLSAGYVLVAPGDDGPLITCERPEQVITEHDARRQVLVRAGLKVYRDAIGGDDVAFLHLPGVVFTYKRPARDLWNRLSVITSASGGWQPVVAMETGLEFVPIYPFVNRGGLGEFETHIDVLDRINWDVLQRLVIMAMQAYRQRATKGDLPVEDEAGEQIDYAEMFRPGPGALWQLPEGVELWESQTTDLTPVLAASKDDITHLAAVTRTPMSTLMPDSANQSAEGASFAREGLVFKTGDRVERAGAQWDAAMGAALAIEQGLPRPVEDVQTLWMPVERQSLAERADAASKAQDVPWRTRMTDIWQFPADRVDRMETERAGDQLSAALANPFAPPPAPTQNQVPDGQPAA
jgi:hypothetical protein